MEKDRIEKFREMILDDSYITWLSNFLEKNKEIDNIYFLQNYELNENDKKMLDNLGCLFSELRLYYMKNNDSDPYKNIFYMFYKCKFISIMYNGKGYICKVFNDGILFYYKNKDNFAKNGEMYICYDDFKEQYISNKFSKLDDLINRVLDKPREFYEKICDELTIEERLFIREKLKNKDCTTCLNGSCNVENYEKIGLNEYGKPQGYECIGWNNCYLIGKSKVLKIDDIYKLLY